MVNLINSKDFAELREQLHCFEERREEVIQKSRETIRSSKTVITAVHCNDQKRAQAAHKELVANITALRQLIQKNPGLCHIGLARVAEQEYVEAAAYLAFVFDKSLPTAEELQVDVENYLAGLCDLIGELMRRATNSAIKENYQDAVAIREFIAQLYDELIQFELRNGDLRRKFDGIKYELKKVENLVLELKLKEKI